MRIYLDHSATTPIDERVLRAMMPYFSHKFGNPSSIHQFGQEARHAVDKARADIARLINSSPEEIIFTSGGSEADNLAIKGIVDKAAELNGQKFLPHIIISAIEHKAVIETVKKLGKEGKMSVTYIKPDENGRISEKKVRKAIKPKTILVSIMYINNETGVIQPIREIGKIIEKINEEKTKKGKSEKIYFHSDAVQAAPSMNLDVKYLHLDMMTLSAHKIYGPKGIGLLFMKKGTPISAQITGGEQENGRRAGTENVASIVGFAQALRNIRRNNLSEGQRLKKLRDYFEAKICKEISGIIINGGKVERAPHISNLSFKGAEGESILLSLDLENIAASSGSACTSGSLEPSHVLLAMRLPAILAQSSVRFSLGKENTKQQLDLVITKLKEIIKRLRKMSAL
jgi:cysteine desulfurase